MSMNTNGHANGTSNAMVVAHGHAPSTMVHPPLPAPPDAVPAYDVIGVLMRRWRTIVLTTVVALAIAVTYCLVATPWYEAPVTILIESRPPQLLYGKRVDEEQDAFTSAKYDYYQTQFALLQSPTLAERVITELGLAKDPRFLGPDVAPGSVPFGMLAKQYLQQIEVIPVRGTRLVTVYVYSRDPELAGQIANTHARLFVRRGLERSDMATEQVRSFLDTKLATLRGRMEEAELRLTRYQTAHRMLPVPLTQGVEQERFTDLNRRLTAAEAERIGLEAQHRLVAQGAIDRLPAVVENPLIRNLRGDLNKLEVQHALMARIYKSTYPPVAELGSQVASARQLLREEMQKVAAGVEESYAAARRTVRELQRRLAEERRVLLSQRDNEGELLRLTTDAETTRALHANVLARIKELDVAGGADTSNMSIVEPATIGWQSSPALLFDLLLSLVTGLVLGTGVAFLRDALEVPMRDGQDLRRATGLDTLAVIPDFDAAPLATLERLRWHAARGVRRLSAPLARRETHVTRALSAVRGPGPHIEAYRTLRASLILRRNGLDPRIILVSSAAAREGKTTTSVNTALMLARCGARVLLIDGDLRLPRCHDALNAGAGPGLSEFLAATMPMPAVQETSHPNLSFLAAGAATDADPTELLSSPRLAYLLVDARKRFDYVVVDSPPLLAVADGLLIASVVDGVILVADRARCAADRLQLAIDRLHRAGATVLGTVLNRGDLDFEYYRYGYERTPQPTVNGTGAPHVEVA